jgi:hypothetical protein
MRKKRPTAAGNTFVYVLSVNHFLNVDFKQMQIVNKYCFPAGYTTKNLNTANIMC